MFNSQKINQYPNPYTLVNLDGNVIGRVSSKQLNGLVSCRFEPREEYDNDPNPILEGLRTGEFEPVPLLEWLDDNWDAPIDPGESWFTWEHRNHARKVLTKLVNVYGEEQ